MLIASCVGPSLDLPQIHGTRKFQRDYSNAWSLPRSELGHPVPDFDSFRPGTYYWEFDRFLRELLGVGIHVLDEHIEGPGFAAGLRDRLKTEYGVRYAHALFLFERWWEARRELDRVRTQARCDNWFRRIEGDPNGWAAQPEAKPEECWIATQYQYDLVICIVDAAMEHIHRMRRRTPELLALFAHVYALTERIEHFEPNAHGLALMLRRWEARVLDDRLTPTVVDRTERRMIQLIRRLAAPISLGAWVQLQAPLMTRQDTADVRYLGTLNRVLLPLGNEPYREFLDSLETNEPFWSAMRPCVDQIDHARESHARSGRDEVSTPRQCAHTYEPVSRALNACARARNTVEVTFDAGYLVQSIVLHETEETPQTVACVRRVFEHFEPRFLGSLSANMDFSFSIGR